MGYCIEQMESEFAIPSENFDQALSAVKGMMDGYPTPYYSWVVNEEVTHAKSLVEALWAWRWEAVVKEGDIHFIVFCGEKLGADDHLFRVLAPFVRSGSYISFRGEDGALWQFYFENGTMRERQGRVIFE